MKELDLQEFERMRAAAINNPPRGCEPDEWAKDVQSVQSCDEIRHKRQKALDQVAADVQKSMIPEEIRQVARDVAMLHDRAHRFDTPEQFLEAERKYRDALRRQDELMAVWAACFIADSIKTRNLSESQWQSIIDRSVEARPGFSQQVANAVRAAVKGDTGGQDMAQFLLGACDPKDLSAWGYWEARFGAFRGEVNHAQE
jgi:hypothetical protein